MTINGVIYILRYFTEFDSFVAAYVNVVEDRPVMSAEYRLPLLAKTLTYHAARSMCDS